MFTGMKGLQSIPHAATPPPTNANISVDQKRDDAKQENHHNPIMRDVPSPIKAVACWFYAA